MRIRGDSQRLHKRTRFLTTTGKLKQKMESRRRGKRKSPCQDIIFEVSENDMSPESVNSDNSEPEAKILKTDTIFFQTILNENSNLQNDIQQSPKVAAVEELQVDKSVAEVENETKLSETTGNVSITSSDIEKSKEQQENIDNPDSKSINRETSIEEGREVEKKPQDHIATSSYPEGETCMCITFSNNSIAELYRIKFLKFINSLVELEAENTDSLTIKIRRDPFLNPSDWVVIDESICLSEVKELLLEEKLASPLPVTPEKPQSHKKKKKKGKKEKELFVVDTNPSRNENVDTATKYLTKFQIDINESHPNDKNEVKISTQTCFNCGSNHALKDCSEQKDYAKIKAARLKFQTKKQTARYHLEEDQKYGNLAPGKISEKLRDALGLKKNQLPPFTYRMRELGYPPGWLEEAKFVHSNLAMFDSDGNNVKEAKSNKNQGLDPDKIVNYPGFNVPMEKGTKDEYRHHHAPPYSEKFRKEVMIEYFQKHISKQQDDFETCDMDLDTTFEETLDTVLIIEKVGEEPGGVENREVKELKNLESSLPSPTLIDLEKQKENLLAELEDSSNTKPGDSPCEENKNFVEKSDDIEKSCDYDKNERLQESTESFSTKKHLKLDIEATEDTNSSYSSPPLSSVNSIKNSTFGTPILKSNSPYSRLPNPNNFMKGVSPVIDFENLPNSTGKYEQMTGVLQKVRNTLKTKQNGN